MKSKPKNRSTTPGIDLQPNLGSKLNILTSYNKRLKRDSELVI